MISSLDKKVKQAEGYILSPSIEEIGKEVNKQIKGYAFDSLVLRYKLARDAQARAEKEILIKVYGGDVAEATKKSSEAAKRDILRFIEILEEVIGEHY